MRTYVDQSTGEILAVLSLSTWEHLVQCAIDHCPCAEGPRCTSPGCALARSVIAEHGTREVFGDLRPRDDWQEPHKAVATPRRDG
jgi:hypothetical protein